MNPPKKAPARDPDVDFGDELTPEQIAAQEEPAKELSDAEVDEALAAMKAGESDGDSNDDPKDAKSDDDLSDKSKQSKSKEADPKIPKDRFDEAVQKERDRAEAAEKELSDLKRKARKERRPPPQEDGPTITDAINEATEQVTDARKEWQKALLDNDESKADTALEAMTAAEAKLDQLRLDQSSQVTRQQTTEDVDYNNALTALEKEFPAIDEDSEEFDEELLAKVARLHLGLVRGGTGRVSALKEAADIYLTKPSVKDPKDVKDTLRDGAKTTLAKTVAAQPPDTTSVAHTDTKGVQLQPSRMSRKQFDKLTDEQRSVLRGDEL
jgi:hypothetical protein